MKRTLSIALLALATLTGVRSASAQDSGVRATIPFDFAVGGRVLPRGTNTFTTPLNNTLLIRTGQKAMYTICNASHDIDRTQTRSKLIFLRRGNQYFLRQIDSWAASIHAGIPPASLERKAHSEQASADTESTVLVALN